MTESYLDDLFLGEAVLEREDLALLSQLEEVGDEVDFGDLRAGVRVLERLLLGESRPTLSMRARASLISSLMSLFILLMSMKSSGSSPSLL